MPCFLDGNETPTIPGSFRGKQQLLFPHGKVDGAKNPGSKVYEVNQFLWQYGKGRPKLLSSRVQKSQGNKTKKRKVALAVALACLQEQHASDSEGSELSQASSDADFD